MFNEMLAMGATGGVSLEDKVIFYDILDYQSTSKTFYNEDYFEYVSGAFRPNSLQNGDITFTVKQSVTVKAITTLGSGGSLNISIYVNGVLTPYTDNIQLKSGDTLRYVNNVYYAQIILLITEQ